MPAKNKGGKKSISQLAFIPRQLGIWFYIIFIAILVIFSVVVICYLNKNALPIIGDWPKGPDPLVNYQADQVFTSQIECEKATGYICSFRSCDYIPAGKTFDEVCGKNFRKGWYPSQQPIQNVCTLEAKLCPDGSSVGRGGPNCDFATCPGTDNPATVKIGGQIIEQGISISPLEVVEDSRCPDGVLCVWAGTVKLRARLKKESQVEEAVLELGKPTIFSGTEVLLTEVSPAPKPGQTIPPDQYIFSFILTTNQADGETYKNYQYGFEVRLPASWKGYRIAESQKDIYDTNTQDIAGHFPLIEIIHPLAEKEAPRQNIPIFIFTQDQWKQIGSEQSAAWSVSAAPFPPSELGENSMYVFALPARYNYAFLTGWEEVQKIIDGRPLTAFELTGASTAPIISSLEPNNGPTGTQVIINGNGVWTSGARAIFSQAGAGEESVPLTINDMSNESFFFIPQSIPQYFTCPSEIVDRGAVCSQPPPLPVTPGIYKVKVSNNFGESNSLEFTVTPTSDIK